MHSAAELKEAAVKFVVEHSEEFVDQVASNDQYLLHIQNLNGLSSISKETSQVDKFKPYPDLMAELFKAMARSPPTKRRK